MSIINPLLSRYSLELDHYNLTINSRSKETLIKMSLRAPHLYTKTLPGTYFILDKILPGVLKTKCFNDENLPFSKEVLNTEMGHLFEHILLEYLCEEKLAAGAKSAFFKGYTNWNWKKDRKGVFHITLYMDGSEGEIFRTALDKTIKLLDHILVYGKDTFSETN